MTVVSSTQQVPETGAVPRHVAIIMDGNGRWATERLLPRSAGHVRGVQAVRRIAQACGRRGVRYLTLFAFSSENWRRPPEEVSLLMRLFMQTLEKRIDTLARKGVRLRIVGDLTPFEPPLQQLIAAAHTRTQANMDMHLTIAANYGGRWDILQAMQRLLQTRPDLAQQPHTLSETLLTPHLAMAWAPEPDLLIRTGGEQRISNFLIWQLAYTELYFTQACWPAFGVAELEQAFAWYRTRERRFGRTSMQLMQGTAQRQGG